MMYPVSVIVILDLPTAMAVAIFNSEPADYVGDFLRRTACTGKLDPTG
jgi:hypothetical protein